MSQEQPRPGQNGPPGPKEMQGELERSTGRHLKGSIASGLSEYVRLLLQWNERMNLVGSKDWKSIVRHLVLDSLFLADFLVELELPSEPRVLDVGAGAGIPGIPLRLFWSQGEYHLLEPRQKRAAFLQFVLSRIRLSSTRVRRSRLEDLPPEEFCADLILSRGVRSWNEFLPLAAPYLRPQGMVLLFSSSAWTTESQPPADWIFVQQRAYKTAPEVPQRYFWLFGLRKASS